VVGARAGEDARHVTFLALISVLALQLPGEPPAPLTPWLTGGSVYRSATTHVGVRPAVLVTNDGPEWGLALTAQVSTRTPW
jgi:hypothetical protein